VPPAVGLPNYISSGILRRIFCQTGIFAGFSLHIMNNAVRISEAATGGAWEIIQYFLRCYSLYYSPEGSARRRWTGQGSVVII
jgi:hypothetical protein